MGTVAVLKTQSHWHPLEEFEDHLLNGAAQGTCMK